MGNLRTRFMKKHRRIIILECMAENIGSWYFIQFTGIRMLFSGASSGCGGCLGGIGNSFVLTGNSNLIYLESTKYSKLR